VQDNAIFPLTATQSFQVVVEEVNQKPILPSFEGILASEGEETVIPSQGTRGEKLFSSKSAVKDAGEPNHCRVLGGASTWFIYEPPQSGALRVSTEGSSYDTVLAAYLSPTLDVDCRVRRRLATNGGGTESILRELRTQPFD